MGMGGFGSLKKTLMELRKAKRGSKALKKFDEDSIERKENNKANKTNDAAHNYF